MIEQSRYSMNLLWSMMTTWIRYNLLGPGKYWTKPHAMVDDDTLEVRTARSCNSSVGALLETTYFTFQEEYYQWLELL